MPRRKRLPSHRLHRPSGCGVVTLDGHDHYTGKYGTEAARRRYDELIAAWLLQKPLVPTGPRAGLRVWELVERYAATEPQAHLCRLAGRLLRDRLGEEPAAGLTAGALKRWRDWLLAEAPHVSRHGKAKVGYRPGTVNILLVRAKQLYRWAAEEELVPGECWHALCATRPVALTRGRVRPVDPEVLKATLAGSHAILAALLRVQYLAGMRPGEAMGLTPADLGPSEFPGVWLYRVAPRWNKNHWRGQERLVFLGPQAQTVLAPLLAGRSPGRAVFCPAEAPHISAAGGHYSAQTLHSAVRSVTRRKRLPDWHPNQLRHLRATEIRRDYGSEAAAVVLGHRRGVTSIYAEPDYALAARVMRESG